MTKTAPQWKLTPAFVSLVILGGAILSGCGSGLNPSSSSSSSIPVTIIGAKGTINGATVTMYTLDGSGNRAQTLGSCPISASTCQMSLAPQSSPVEFSLGGGTYVDEATATSIPMDDFTMRLRLPSLTVAQTVFISALTEMAVQRYEQLTGTVAEKITAANEAVATEFNLSTITTVKSNPVLAPSDAASDDAKYGLVLSSISQYASNVGASTTDVVTALAQDFAANGNIAGGGTIPLTGGGTASTSLSSFVTATSDFIANPNNPGFTSASNTTLSFPDLSGLTISSGTLSPSFTDSTTWYTTSVAASVSSITITPTVLVSGATVKVNGTAVSSGTASAPISMSVGNNTVTVVATSPDETATKTYTLVVTRAVSSDATLSALSLSSGTLSPSFASGTTSYTASIPNGTSSITVTPTVNQANATVTVNGTTVTSASASGSLAMSVGSNTVTVVVTAQDGTTTATYTVTVTRDSGAPSSDATLSALSFSSGTLSPAFSSATTDYATTITNDTASITVTPTVNQANATVTVNGTTVSSASASGSLAMSVGLNTVTVVVTAQDSSTQDTYTITVMRISGNIYFRDNGDEEWLDPSNWYLDSDFLTPAGDFPSDGSCVIDQSGVFYDTPSPVTLACYEGALDCDSSQMTIGASGILTVTEGGWEGTADASATVTFNNTGINLGVVNGSATFNGNSQNYETIGGDATFNDCSDNRGTITGTLTDNTGASCDTTGGSGGTGCAGYTDQAPCESSLWGCAWDGSSCSPSP